MSALSPVPGSEFTSEMLAKNFVAIAGGFDDFDKALMHMQGHISELSSTVQTLVAKTPKASKFKPFVLGAVVGVVVYKWSTKNRHKIDSIVKDIQVDVSNPSVAAAVDKIKNSIPKQNGV